MASSDDPFARFSNIVTRIEDLEEVIGEPMPQIVAKELPALDSICRDFIAHAPFCFLASSNPAGYLDISPKGDPAGFVKVLDEATLAIPDRPGNRRVDTFHNILKDPRVGLLFLVPGRGETLRIRGEARIVQDTDLLKMMAINDRPPKLALVIHVQSAFMHCPKCVFRSNIWQPENWPDTSGLADMNEAMVKHAQIAMSPEEWFESLKNKGELDLW
ncbi:MAG: pyridoxamine 5'-phosphate oxidase family protein [Roseibium sp.]|uniref:MSMEG_1061 family FMN-dependent PPOX-type flavoprotein n=1 Tax=Roseibium sp. TaxID=1936156 RepID=UPI001B1B4036|nr:MSMEG_1061 family FMN-dependent PPOX-type flavoprotein [Roseibium sp.]MBO6895021.1 pyridoxamine 5'-phosphate oxidase family protein [Roseibium sp.]MBO6931276.1 pyridoxamine 5'-phosphate oxidase family protein [Roseibium sp.]